MNDSKRPKNGRCTNINGAIVTCIARTTIDTAGQANYTIGIFILELVVHNDLGFDY